MKFFYAVSFKKLILKSILPILFYLLLSIALFGQQEIKVHLKENNNYIKRDKFKSTGFSMYPFKGDSILSVKMKGGIKRIQSVRFTLQKNNNIKNKGVLDIVGGSTLDGNLFLIVDKNFNLKFNDDSIYIINCQNGFNNRSDYIKSWPIIKIDSLSYVSANGEVIYYSIGLLASLFSKPSFEFFATKEEILNYQKDFELHTFSYNYLQSNFQFNGDYYELNIDPSPFYYPIYSKISETDQYRQTSVVLYKKNTERDSLIFYKPLVTIKKQIENKESSDMGLIKLQINQISFDSSFIKFSLSKNDSLNEISVNNSIALKEIFGYSLDKKKEVVIAISLKKYNVIFFSGSWCKPCHEAMPYFKKLIKKYVQNTNFITVAYEKNIEEAKKYYTKTKPNWHFLYENNLIPKSTYLTSKFNVNIFPTFIVIEDSGKILFNGISQESLTAIEEILKK